MEALHNCQRIFWQNHVHSAAIPGALGWFYSLTRGENHRPFNNTSHSESGVIFQPINFLLFQQAFCRSFRLQGIHPHTKNKQMFPVPPKKGLSQWEKKKHVLKPLIFKGHVFFLFSELYFVVCPVLLPRVFSIKRSRNSETFQKGCQTKTSLNIWYVRHTVWGRPWLSSWKKTYRYRKIFVCFPHMIFHIFETKYTAIKETLIHFDHIYARYRCSSYTNM